MYIRALRQRWRAWSSGAGCDPAGVYVSVSPKGGPREQISRETQSDPARGRHFPSLRRGRRPALDPRVRGPRSPPIETIRGGRRPLQRVGDSGQAALICSSPCPTFVCRTVHSL